MEKIGEKRTTVVVRGNEIDGFDLRSASPGTEVVVLTGSDKRPEVYEFVKTENTHAKAGWQLKREDDMVPLEGDLHLSDESNRTVNSSRLHEGMSVSIPTRMQIVRENREGRQVTYEEIRLHSLGVVAAIGVNLPSMESANA